LGNYSSALADFEAIAPQKLDPLPKQSIAIRVIRYGVGRREEATPMCKRFSSKSLDLRIKTIYYKSALSEAQIAQLKALIKTYSRGKALLCLYPTTQDTATPQTRSG
jgi:hypothetical protein